MQLSLSLTLDYSVESADEGKRSSLIDPTVFPVLENSQEPPLRDVLALPTLPHDLRLSPDHRGSAPVGDA